MPKTKYFKSQNNAPAPLTHEIKRAVRFDELDPLGIVWHGNYASWFEEARVALGKKYGIGYLDFSDNDMIIPLKKFYVDFSLPLKFDETYTVRALLHYNHAARLDFEFEIYDCAGALATSGYTVHMILDKNGNIQVAKPKFYEDFCKKWEAGKIK